jgi:calcium-dependent protein kinase
VDELREAVALNGKLPMSELEGILQEVDMNSSGAIDYEEFLAATLHASKIATDEHLQRAFKEFDTDGSGQCVGLSNSSSLGCRCAQHNTAESTEKLCCPGTITVDELQQALEGPGGLNPDEIKDIMKKVDKDRDGSIDYAEFVEMMVPKSDGPVRRRKQVIKF